MSREPPQDRSRSAAINNSNIHGGQQVLEAAVKVKLDTWVLEVHLPNVPIVNPAAA